MLTLFPSPRRGGTPASEQVPDDLMTLDEPAPRRGFRPTDEAWADYYRQMFPGHEHPGSAFAAWKYATTAVDVAVTCWEAREKGRADWVAAHGGDISAWPVLHPPFVLHLPQIYWAACLGCTWVVRGGRDPSTAQALVQAMPLSTVPEEERRLPDEDQRECPNTDERILRQLRHRSTQREELHLPSPPGAQILRGSPRDWCSVRCAHGPRPLWRCDRDCRGGPGDRLTTQVERRSANTGLTSPRMVS